ncbi:hypothetical protein [Paenibacillus sp. GP183]|uniref:hypothetical protein n=1 Tax=Paenibacillus sp. GP183 TaxID=1882751 RepID=UPI0008941BAF|nr:hypothetical protein [Paenibacillus sp. GP183]SEC07946.1 hypothetical protein SAMN05443246_2897 [Paenibacillus sp. GP183]
MKTNWKKSLIILILSAALLILPSATFHAIAEEAGALSPGAIGYHLTDSIKVEVKSILNEQTAEGTRLAAVIRLYNEGARLDRVPDYEIRVKSEEGMIYILRPSAANAKNIQPKATVELSYMIMVDRFDTFSLSEISWHEVDEYVYPKQEKQILTIPVSSMEWKGQNGVLADPAANKKWAELFTLPILSASIEFLPVSLVQQTTPQGVSTIVGLLARNKSNSDQLIPDFHFDGKTSKKVYIGKRLDQETDALKPGEQRYLYFSIPIGNMSELKSLNIVSQEEFTADDKTKTKFSIGRLTINLPSGSSTLSYLNQLMPYEWNKPIRFDPLNKLIQPGVDISMVDLRMHESSGGGFKAAVAKFKLQNRSNNPLPVPRFQAVLMNSSGSKFTGTIQHTDVETLIPNVSYILYYSFILPNTETGSSLAMEILDGETFAPINVSIAAFKTQVREETSEKTNAFYPFRVNLNNWKLGYNYMQGNYTYNVILDLDISLQEEAVVDQSFSKLKVEVVDSKGKIMGTKAFSFTGDNRLVSGTQAFSFSLDRQEFSLSLRVYESIDTPFGEAKRLIQTLK